MLTPLLEKPSPLWTFKNNTIFITLTWKNCSPTSAFWRCRWWSLGPLHSFLITVKSIQSLVNVMPFFFYQLALQKYAKVVTIRRWMNINCFIQCQYSQIIFCTQQITCFDLPPIRRWSLHKISHKFIFWNNLGCFVMTNA